MQDTYRPLDELKNWAEYAGEYQSVFHIQATPHLGESFWGAVGRGVAANYGIQRAAKLRFKTDFYRMKLKCGDQEVQPIQPSKIANVIDVRNWLVNANDATYEGFYTYPADAVSPACGRVTLELFSEKKPNTPTIKILDPKSVLRIAADFEPYRQAHPAQ